VSLLTTPGPESQATPGGRLPNYLGSERVISIGACVCPGFLRGIRGPRPASPERVSLRSKPVHPHMRLSHQYTVAVPAYPVAPAMAAAQTGSLLRAAVSSGASIVASDEPISPSEA
jgi:hypothetical protein